MPQSVQPQLQSKKIEVSMEALQPHEIELKKKQELLKKVKSIRENWALSRSRVEQGDPQKHYQWVNIHEERQTWYEGMGYQVTKSKVELDADGRIKIISGPKTKWVRADGIHRRGDLILYEIDRELKEAFDTDSEVRAVEALDSAKDVFKAFADRERVPYNA